jgi:adenylosuccinate synthase
MSSVVIVRCLNGATKAKARSSTFYTEFADVVVRYAGGPNAGHTLVVGDDKLVVRLCRAASCARRRTAFLGQGMVIDPDVLLGEIDELHRRGHLERREAPVRSATART